MPFVSQATHESIDVIVTAGVCRSEVNDVHALVFLLCSWQAEFPGHVRGFEREKNALSDCL